MPTDLLSTPLRFIVPAFIVPVLIVAGVAGCSSGSAAPAGGGEDVAPTETAEAAEPDFCGEYTAAGGTGATVGPVQVYAGRDAVLADVGERLTAMNAVEAPAEVETEWNEMKSYYERISAGFEATNPDAAVGADEQALVEEFTAE